MSSIKTRRLRRKTKSKEEYLKTYQPRIDRGDKTVPTYAQWKSASSTVRGQMKAGIHKPIGVSAAGSYYRKKR